MNTTSFKTWKQAAPAVLAEMLTSITHRRKVKICTTVKDAFCKRLVRFFPKNITVNSIKWKVRREYYINPNTGNKCVECTCTRIN